MISCINNINSSRFQPSDDALANTRSKAQSAIELRTSFEGISGGGDYFVPAPALALGPDSLILVTNGSVEIRTKTGVVVASTLLVRFFDSVLTGNEGAYDPQIVFDPDSERFFLAATGFSSTRTVDRANVSRIFS